MRRVPAHQAQLSIRLAPPTPRPQGRPWHQPTGEPSPPRADPVGPQPPGGAHHTGPPPARGARLRPTAAAHGLPDSLPPARHPPHPASGMPGADPCQKLCPVAIPAWWWCRPWGEPPSAALGRTPSPTDSPASLGPSSCVQTFPVANSILGEAHPVFPVPKSAANWSLTRHAGRQLASQLGRTLLLSGRLSPTTLPSCAQLRGPSSHLRANWRMHHRGQASDHPVREPEDPSTPNAPLQAPGTAGHDDGEVYFQQI